MRNLSLALCFVVLGMFGCGSTEKKPQFKGTVGVSVLTMANPFFKVIADNLTDELGRNGYKVIAVSGEFDVSKQQNQVKDFLVRKVSAIVLCPCDSKAIGAVIKEANDQKVP